MKSFLSKNSDRWLAACTLVLGAFASFAQTTADLNAYRTKYPGQHIVLKKNSYRTTIKMVKDVPVVSHKLHLEHLILDKNGILSLSEENVDFSSFEIMGDIIAYSMIPAEKSSIKIKATNFMTKDAETSGSVFHDDKKETSFIYPNLTEGALRVLEYSTQMTDNSFPFGFNFFSYVPMENAEFVIECDTTVHLLTRLFNGESSNISYTEKLDKNKRIHTWTVTDPVLLKEEDFAPSSKYYAPHLLAQIAYYTSKTGRVNVIQTPKDLHDHYQKNVVEVVNEQPTAELKAIAESVTAGLPTELDKVKAVYYWVQNNIKYIAFEEGMSGYIPRQPSKVIRKRYGDCKDMASLIYSMLKAVDIPAYLTWIGSRDLPYKYTDFPSGACDNHMISVYKNEDRVYFLDATSSFQPHDFPTGFIQGKQAMLHISPTEFEIIDVPVPAAEQTTMIDTARIFIENRNLKGWSSTLVTGYYHILLGDYLRDVPAKDIDKAIRSVNEKGNNSFEVKNARIVNLLDRDQAMALTYDFTVNNYVTSFGNETYVNMVLEKEVVESSEFKAERTAPYELENKSSDSYTVILEVPQGYKVKSIPKNSSFTSDFVAYDVTYKQEKDRVLMTLRLKLDFLMLYPAQFQQWNEFIKIKKASVSDAVVLVKQ